MHWATIAHVLWELLYWPGGIILGNLLASLIWSSLFEWRLTKHHKKTHKVITRVVDEKIAEHKETVAEMLNRHQQETKELVNVIPKTSEPGPV
jgi:hypothetical protein